VASTESGERASALERLRRIESVTDAAFIHLDVEALLDEFLVRVRDALEVDTAAVLLIDEASESLVATAASGIEEEVRQRIRIPLGAGFAGRIAAEGKPRVIDDISTADVFNPIIRQSGIRTLAGAPLVTEGRVVGVIHVGSLSTRRFGPEDVDLLEKVAGLVALSVEARRSNIERTTAAALQRSLIPTRLPTVPGLEFAARYLPADEGGVGGDWYDVFGLPDGHLGVVMGDVVGRGLGAAVVMGRLRSALRAYALDALDPAEVLERLDRKLQHFEPGQMTTVLYGVIDLTCTTIRIASAGHPLPILAIPGSTPAIVEADVDLPLGVAAVGRRRTTTIDLPSGAVLALFTDGLVERRGESMDVGLGRLAAELTSESAEENCRAVVAALVPRGGWADDAALLVIRRDGAEPDR
jgi:putative methionine-R-sulfoxide reductase with GAF domain